MKSFSELVAQAESLAVDLEEDDIPRVRRRMEELRGVLTEDRDGGGRRAGLSEAVRRSLEGVRVAEGASEAEDVAAFLCGEREAAILRAIEAVKSKTESECRIRTERACGDWWKEEKKKIVSALASGEQVVGSLVSGERLVGPAYSGDRSNELMLSNFTDSVVKRDDFEGQNRVKFGKEESNYAREVSIYVGSLLTEGSTIHPLSLCELLLSEERAPMSTTKYMELTEIARLITRYCTITSQHNFNDKDISKRMISAALVHLQSELLTYLQQYINTISNTACLNNRSLLVAYLNTQDADKGSSSEDGFIDGVSIWSLIYLCLRTGLTEEAIQVAKDASSNIGDWYIWLGQFLAEGRVSYEYSKKITTDFKRNVRGSNDGYKRLIYCIVGGCDMEDNHPQVLMNVDDFMWARLSHLQRSYYDQESLQVSLNKSRRSASFEQQSLLQLQRLISEEYGESHFQAQQQPITYCKLLLLCQLPEVAIAFLARFNYLRCHSVHLGLVLLHNNLLMVPDNIKAPLLSRNEQDSQGTTRLNLSRLVTLYTRTFESLYAKETLDLFFLLSDLPNDNINPFVSLASSLVFEHGHLDLILGNNNSLGLISSYGRGMREEVLNCVANRFIAAGRADDACDCLLIAGRFPEAAEILTNLLASSLTLPNSHQQESLRLRSKAEHLLQMMFQCKEADILSKVLDILTFMTLSIQGDVGAALIALDRTDLLPSSTDTGRIRSLIESFRSLPEIVRNLTPSVIVTTMRLLKEAALQRRSLSLDSMNDVRRRASALITFAGQLPFRLSADIYASLSQLEMNIN